MITELVKLGLSEKEAKVYLACLTLGTQTVQAIAREAKVNRATTYVILKGLMSKGLVSTITEDKKTVFVAEPPEQLDHLLRKQEEDLFERRRDLAVHLGALKALHNQARTKPTVRLYEGLEGIRAMQADVQRLLPLGAELLEFLNLDEALATFPNFAGLSSFHLHKQHLSARVIYTHPDGPQAGMDDPAARRMARFLSPKDYPLSGSILVIPSLGRMVISTYQDGFSGVMIENSSVAQTQAALFLALWNQLGQHV